MRTSKASSPCRYLNQHPLLEIPCPKSARETKRNGWNLSLRQGNLESLLNLLQDILIVLAANERNAKTFGAESAGSADPVQVGVGVARQVVVDGQIDSLNVNTTTKDIRGYADTLVELFELLVALDTIVDQLAQFSLHVANENYTVPPG